METYSTWTVTSDDGELTHGETRLLPESYKAQSIELISPVFRFDDPQSFSQIREMLEALKWLEQRFKCHFIVNKTCGFHVHFACGKEKIPDDTAKCIYQIFLAHERTIDSIHARSRVLAPAWKRHDDIERPLYAPLSAFQGAAHLLRNSIQGEQDRNLFAWLRRVEHCDDYGDICKMFEAEFKKGYLDGHCANVNFDNAHAHTDRNGAQCTKTTIEFRQHLGTREYDEMYRYVKFLGSVITCCQQASDEAFIETLLSATSPTYSFDQLCQAVNVPEDARALFLQTPPSIATFPAVETPYGAPSIGQFLAQNAHENALNRDPADVNRMRAEKYSTGYYGIQPNAQPLIFDQEKVKDLLVSAREDLSRSRFEEVTSSSLLSDEEQNDKVIARMNAKWNGK
ncbi:hypothetical protein CLAFUW4_13255 [Fulvia fulva]|uniref:Amidoligase enzyme n=1 Tax=Passalora fulva TaxID=5499 RepID=A0A9Q8PIL5_PASFU|nr:uncharacterized protein CLAFUR5_13111 [Fulvia fulva]KAK4611980.1 hypothetical protein CLAFUR4_13260 [Fulvia fulva]KAK4612425.1 hypothetical protein CLAFUR0_13265 [Fulvia fulva]UJO23339.1 hypothetical protein CLAFUR5_13111 [Fulvia fulva]WPV20987.1 hypothetical protein CLAFUW4_13255 [Fulvia fulva]WPV36216.1 hypothetical protein CLAFUW7_13262 [Fulvia fulva]